MVKDQPKRYGAFVAGVTVDLQDAIKAGQEGFGILAPAAAQYQPARADVTITFLPDGSNVKMIYSGTITGTPVGAPGWGSSANFQDRQARYRHHGGR
jgi:hypothetical protein